MGIRDEGRLAGGWPKVIGTSSFGLRLETGILRCIAIALAFVCGLASMSLAAESSRPNILFILSDDHSSQTWGVYGSRLDSFVDNPNIDRLASEGTLLLNAFCANSICVPSRATILTGQHSHRNGVYTLSDGLDPKRETFVTQLREAGYQTALFGKWHLKERPSGFDSFKVLPGQGRYWNPILRGSDDWDSGGEVIEGFSADVIGDLCLSWLEERDERKPFLLLCHFKATHEPFDYPKRHAELYREVDLPEPQSLHEDLGNGASRTFVGQRLEVLGSRYESGRFMKYPGEFEYPPDADERERRSVVYQKLVKDVLRSGKAIDDNIGRLLDYLDEAGLSENTVVIYAADQGYFLGEHGMFDKRIMYEEPLRMPVVLRYPKEIKKDERLSDLIQNTDFAPLILDYAEIEKGSISRMDGRSFRANLRGDSPRDWRTEIYYRYWQHQANRPAHYGIRTVTEKLIHFYASDVQDVSIQIEDEIGTWEYYDLVEDPYETNNLADDPSKAKEYRKLKKRLERLKSQVERPLE